MPRHRVYMYFFLRKGWAGGPGLKGVVKAGAPSFGFAQDRLSILRRGFWRGWPHAVFLQTMAAAR